MALPSREMQAAIAANRFGIGARPGDLSSIIADPREWLFDQLIQAPPADIPDPAGGLRPGAENLAAFFQNRAVRRAMKDGESAAADEEIRKGGNLVQRIVDFNKPILLAEVAARTQIALDTRTPLLERLVWFWSNHFTVSADKPVVTPIAGAFEREAIRPNILGRFEDMLLAAIRHPAMILYLDNHASFGPNSRVGRRRGRGLNENLAREVLELHTVGVHGGYRQDDVRAFAKALTGWTVNNGRRKRTGIGEFWYVDWVHEPGACTVMGRRYADEGERQARAILRDLARHPATAQHIALKLARHFIADTPPEAVVASLRETFLATGGDLRAVMQALIRVDAVWAVDQQKVKSPQEFLTSSLRAVGAPEVEPGAVFGSLETMGQRPFFAPSPAGWPDTTDAWTGADAIYKRIEWAVAAGERIAPFIGAPELVALDALGAQAGDELLTSMGRAESTAQAIALMLASPEFQRR